MGASSWSNDAYSSLKKDYSTKSTTQIFTKKSIASDMSPKGVKFRESRDSDTHPNSLAIYVALDETGSMGEIPSILVKEKLGSLMTTLIDHGVPDAHVLFGGIGDHYSDSSPLQVGQFEAGTDELNKWLTSIYLEGCGGGQNMESYLLAWLFAGRHTSMGFGAAIERTQNTPYKLFAVDLSYPVILKHKLQQVAQYYNISSPGKDIERFMEYCENISLNICTLQEIKNNYTNIVFEGAQGIMLDMDHGFFPNVTRSNTTSKNALQIIKEAHLPPPQIYYVMRSYLTRHGNGWMPNEDSSLNFEDFTNLSHPYQGNFRQGAHSLNMLNYALKCNNTYSYNCSKSLVITCLNQTEGYVLADGLSFTPEEIGEQLEIKDIYTSFSKTEMCKQENFQIK